MGQVIEQVAVDVNLPRARCTLRGERDAKVDADALGRVLANLLRNALEASPSARVTIDARVVRGELELVVQDDGPGITGELADRVFEPFVSSKQKGTGLGLALSARVLSFLGGGLELLNPGEPGARFRVRVPIVASDDGEAEATA
ncbi:MAG TPA: ATP-binding protein [bacterium]|nr:ATP-binding protein [bacterium]